MRTKDRFEESKLPEDLDQGRLEWRWRNRNQVASQSFDDDDDHKTFSQSLKCDPKVLNVFQ